MKNLNAKTPIVFIPGLFGSMSNIHTHIHIPKTIKIKLSSN